MKLSGKKTIVLAVASAAMVAASSGAQAFAEDGNQIARITSEKGNKGALGFCQFSQIDGGVSVRVVAHGLDKNEIFTTWKKINTDDAALLDGTIADNDGVAEFRGSVMGDDIQSITIIIADHDMTIQSIGNAPVDPVADDMLVEELTTTVDDPKPGKCSVTF